MNERSNDLPHTNIRGNQIIQFVFLVVVMAVLGSCSKPSAENQEVQEPAADLIFTNGYVYTVDSNRSVAQAIAVRDGRIVFVGDDEGVDTYVGPETKQQDLDGRMMMPGIHDMHIHAAGIVEPDKCDLDSESKSLEEMVVYLKACVTRYELPAGEWLVVLQWPFSSGNQPSEQLPTLRAALDAVSDEHPIILWGDDGHHGAVNSLALAEAKDRQGNKVGLSVETLDSTFSDYREMVAVDQNGEPSGGLNETARLLVRPSLMADMMGIDSEPDKLMPGIAGRLASKGITTIQDPWSELKMVELYGWLHENDNMTFRVRTALFQQPVESHLNAGLAQIRDHVANFRALSERYADHPYMQVNGVKLMADAVLEGNPFTQPPTLPVAAVLNGFKQPRFGFEPASGQISIDGFVDPDSQLCTEAKAMIGSPAGPETKQAFADQHGFFPEQCLRSSGVLEHSEEFIHEYVRQMTEAGFHVHIHALSDRAVRVAGEAFSRVKQLADETGLTQSVTHVQLAHPDDQKRLGDLGIYVVWTYVWAQPDLEYDVMVIPFIEEVNGIDDLYNPDSYYMKNVYPVRTMKDHGAIPVFGSDVPVGSRDPIPFVSMAASVSRESEGVVLNAVQRLTIEEAIESFTINGARLMGHDAELGTIETGKKADLIVLDRNVVELANSGRVPEIFETQVDLTVFDGKVVYDRSTN